MKPRRNIGGIVAQGNSSSEHLWIEIDGISWRPGTGTPQGASDRLQAAICRSCAWECAKRYPWRADVWQLWMDRADEFEARL